MRITYLGTATLALNTGSTSLLTDPTFDPRGSTYDFGLRLTPRSWFASEKQYETPVSPESLGKVDAVLLSHDHHADNLDVKGRIFVADDAKVGRVITTVAGARRLARSVSASDPRSGRLGLGERVLGLPPGAATRVGDVTITATVARHGPWYAPQVHQVIGFLLDVDGGPRIWISGDTVLFPPLRATLAEIKKQRPVDVAIVHCGAVGFSGAPGLRHARFTFDAGEAIDACREVGARTIVPVHRSGWSHFREPESALRLAFAAAGLGPRTRFLALNETVEL